MLDATLKTQLQGYLENLREPIELVAFNCDAFADVSLHLTEKADDGMSSMREIDSYTLEKRFVRKDGEIVLTDLTVSCIRNETGDVRNVLASFQDITERKHMEEDLQAQVSAGIDPSVAIFVDEVNPRGGILSEADHP